MDPGYLSEPRAIEFPTEGGLTAFMNYYPPQNRVGGSKITSLAVLSASHRKVGWGPGATLCAVPLARSLVRCECATSGGRVLASRQLHPAPSACVQPCMRLPSMLTPATRSAAVATSTHTATHAPLSPSPVPRTLWRRRARCRRCWLRSTAAPPPRRLRLSTWDCSTGRAGGEGWQEEG